jgi:hypothetical protein
MAASIERPLFISQEKLTVWEGEGKVRVEKDTLTLLPENRTYSLVEAVRFMRSVGDEPDRLGLLGKVRTREQLRQLGAEQYMDSAIIGEAAYQVQLGFVGTVLHAQPVPFPPPARLAATVRGAPVVMAPVVPQAHCAGSGADELPRGTDTPELNDKPASSATDAEMLADFLLTNLAG